jgi:hypothetical protein
MVKKVKYGEATCDICGRVVRFNDEKILPEDWKLMTILGEKDRDVCDRCDKSIHELMTELHKNFQENRKRGAQG